MNQPSDNGQLGLKRYENWHQPWCVIHGAGALESLPDELRRLGGDRVLLVTTRSLTRARSLLDGVRARIGPALAAEFDRCDQHTPRRCVLEVAAAARSAGATAIVAVGGSSVADTAKGAALALAEGFESVDDFDDYRQETVRPAPATTTVPTIAIPTTLSGAEYSNVVGILDPRRHTKDLYSDDRLTIRTIILDPEQARSTPPALWAATGVKSLAGAIEKVYSRTAHPVVEVLSLKGIALLNENLRPTYDELAVLRCFVGAWLANFAGPSARTAPGVGAALRHEVGAVSGAGHGEVTSVLTPHVLRFALPAAPHVVGPLADALSINVSAVAIDSAIEAIAGRIETLAMSLGLPSRLDQIGVSESALTRIAESVSRIELASNPRRISSPDQLLTLLRAAYSAG